MNAATLVNQTSGLVEYYTPSAIIEAARATMGGIDLDPASCEMAQLSVNAGHYYTKEMDGLRLPWCRSFGPAKVFLNPPFHRGWTACTPSCARKSCLKADEETGVPRGHIYEDIPSTGDWIDYLLMEFEKGNVSQACCLTFAATSEAWFRPLMGYPQCFLSPRTNYVGPDGAKVQGVTKGSAVTYLGPAIESFRREFGAFGAVKV